MRLLAFLASVLCSFFSGVVLHDLHCIKTVRYRLRAGDTGKKLIKKLRMAVISDLHGRRHGVDNARLIAAIESARPDIVVMAGDIMTAKDVGYSVSGSVDTAEALIRALSSKYPVYYGIGNHEAKVRWFPWSFDFRYRDMLRRFRDAGAHVLSNRSVLLSDYGVRIYGLDLPQYYYDGRDRVLPTEYMENKLGAADGESYNVLIAHNPEHLRAYARWGADLSLSGHYHGGIVRIPGLGGVINPRLQIFPKYTGGLYREGGKAQVVSCGIGSHTIPLRVFNPVELAIVDIET